MDTSIDSSIHGQVESWGLSTTQAHVCDGSLVALLSLVLLVVGGSPLDTSDDIGHATAAVASEDLDSLDVGFLGNTKLLAGDSAGAMCSVAVAIFIGVTLWDGLAPLSPALEVDVVDVCTSVDNIGSNTLTTLGSVQVLRAWLVLSRGQLRDSAYFVECRERETLPVGDTGQAPRSILLNIWLLLLHGVNHRVKLDVLDIRMPSHLFDGIFIEVARITHQAWHVVGVLQALVDLLLKAYLVSLLELCLHHLLLVDILYPALMGLGASVRYMALEDDHVVVGNWL